MDQVYAADQQVLLIFLAPLAASRGCLSCSPERGHIHREHLATLRTSWRGIFMWQLTSTMRRTAEFQLISGFQVDAADQQVVLIFLEMLVFVSAAS